MQIGHEVVFSEREVERFAALTLDRNPIHMDPRIAQRSFAGARVVHGMHVVLVALDQFVAERTASVWFHRVRCEFRYPIVVGETVHFELLSQSADVVKLSVFVGQVGCIRIRLSEPVISEALGAASPAPAVDSSLDAVCAPLDLGPRELAGFSGTISNARSPELTAMFASLCAAVGDANVSALARFSYIVGMLCPGMYSVFSSLDVTLSRKDIARGFTAFSVKSVDERVRLVDIALVCGDVTGTLSAFQRPPPFEQPSSASLSSRVQADEFVASRTLIIGGSRGLGELTAKLLCAGGGVVHLGYARGAGDANRISTEIARANDASCKPLHLDVLEPFSDEALKVVAEVDFVFYFATPMIFRRKTTTYDRAIFEDFLLFYVDRFRLVCDMLESTAVRPVQVFYPSSTAVESRPRGMTEYAMAKAAGEILVSDLNATLSRVRIVSARLPRLGTDQTNAITSADENADGVEIMLGIIRSLQRHSAPICRTSGVM